MAEIMSTQLLRYFNSLLARTPKSSLVLDTMMSIVSVSAILGERLERQEEAPQMQTGCILTIYMYVYAKT